MYKRDRVPDGHTLPLRIDSYLGLFRAIINPGVGYKGNQRDLNEPSITLIAPITLIYNPNNPNNPCSRTPLMIMSQLKV